MDEITVTPKMVRDYWSATHGDAAIPEAAELRAMREVLFDQMIETIQAKAWHEGFCRGEVSGQREFPLNPYTENPYRGGL